MARAFLVVLALSGCAETQTAVEDARAAVRQTGESLVRVREIVIAVCSEPPPAPDFCPELVSRFNDLQSAYTTVNEAMP